MRNLLELYHESNGIIDFEPVKKAFQQNEGRFHAQCKPHSIKMSLKGKMDINILRESCVLHDQLRRYYGSKINFGIQNNTLLIYAEIELN